MTSDLIVDPPTVNESAPAAGASFTLNAKVRNQGDGSSTFTTLRYYQSTDSTITTSDTEVGTDSVSRIKASQGGDESVSLTAPSTPGTYYYGACVDAVSDESDTTNNCSSAVKVTVGAAVADSMDYDSNSNGLIEISKLEQFNAIRWDLNGDGVVDESANISTYTAAFPNAADNMGCPSSGCKGYELTRNLDFKSAASYASGTVNQNWRTGTGWDPIGGLRALNSGSQTSFNTEFDGNGRTISNLYIDYSGQRDNNNLGLFGRTLSDSYIHDIGLANVDVSGGWSVGGLVGDNDGAISDSYATGEVSGLSQNVGGLVGGNDGTISASHADVNVSGDNKGNFGGLVGSNTGIISSSYATGRVSNANTAGGLVGINWNGAIATSYATGDVSGWYTVGGLVGANLGNAGPSSSAIISASYATGNVSASWRYAGGLVGTQSVDVGSSSTGSSAIISASYSTGTVSAGEAAGGLVGNNGGKIHTSYWDTTTSNQSTSAGGVGKTTSELQSPTGYTGIYASWNIDLDGDGSSDNPWVFGTSSQYPTLNTVAVDKVVPPSPTVTAPGAPTGLTATANGQTQIDLSWTKPSDDGGATITGYKIEVSTNGSSWSDLVTNTRSTGASYSHTGLTAGSTRHYRVSAINSAGTGLASNVDNATTDSPPAATAPDAPTGLTATANGQTQIDLSWTKPSDDGGATITGYRIEVSTDGTSWSDLVANTRSTGASYSHTGLTAGSARHYRVSAINSAGTGLASNVDNATTDSPPAATAPDAPTGLTATANGQTQIDLSWIKPSDDGGATITGYRIEVSTDGTSWSDLVANTRSTSTSYSHTGLTAGATRHYRVSAINSAGAGPASNTDSATTEAAPATRPGAPTGLTATADGQTEIDLSWTAPSSDGGADITGYRIEVSTGGSSWSDLVADTGSTTTSYSHTGLTAGATRHYRVSAINSAGAGPASNTDSATTEAEPVSDATCTVDLIVKPGESCTYPGTSTEFSVASNGTGRFLFTSSGSKIEMRNTIINGITYTFVASKQSDGNWLVEEVG